MMLGERDAVWDWLSEDDLSAIYNTPLDELTQLLITSQQDPEPILNAMQQLVRGDHDLLTYLYYVLILVRANRCRVTRRRLIFRKAMLAVCRQGFLQKNSGPPPFSDLRPGKISGGASLPLPPARLHWYSSQPVQAATLKTWPVLATNQHGEYWPATNQA